MQLQLALEDALSAAVSPEQIRICHHSALDPLAYRLRSGWGEDEFSAFSNIRHADLLRRYHGVLHLIGDSRARLRQAIAAGEPLSFPAAGGEHPYHLALRWNEARQRDELGEVARPLNEM